MDIENQTEQIPQNLKHKKPDRIKLLTIAKKASKLLLENRIMKSLMYYEQALLGLKDLLGSEQCETDYQYLTTAIYRELAIAKFGDKSCLDRLENYRKISITQNLKDLNSLCSYFIILSTIELRELYINLHPYILDIYDANIPEHVLPVKLLTAVDTDIKELIPLMKKVTKIIGSIDIYLNTKEEIYRALSPFDKAEVDSWYKQYILPIEQAQQETYNNLTKGLNSEVVVCGRHCEYCQSLCCYDGVYLEDNEVEKITDLIKTAEYFKDIGDNFIVKGDWQGLENKYKTARVWHPEYDRTFPEHFTKTRCIFRLESGDCALQRYAIDNGYHPWKFKPKSCWLFPLTENKDENDGHENGNEGELETPLVNPPLTSSDKNKDPNNLGKQYPGYVTYLPCVEAPDAYGEQIIWYDKYIHEIEYLKLQKESED